MDPVTAIKLGLFVAESLASLIANDQNVGKIIQRARDEGRKLIADDFRAMGDSMDAAEKNVDDAIEEAAG